ncbi:MAG: cysteine--tRNA ligase [Elusimicrobia bacterium]|nr:cysteine--tRNA ligase [Elusimicrobiota bacterium]
MALELFNTLTRRRELFEPLEPRKAGLYTCGPTVYNYQHVGNYRTYVFEDVLVRTLKFLEYEVRRVMNITDVGHLTSQADEGEDKMEVGAAREGKTAWDIAKFYTEAFLRDCAELNILPPDILCKATDHIEEQQGLIRRLETAGYIYMISDGLYFDTSKFNGYGRLMGADHIGGLKAGARVEANPQKKNPTDFAVWKFSPKGKKRQMEWDSPWGAGFPGWHVECSAMAMKYLGETFDIHCGGVDHIPIHHTNEIAQSEGATKKVFARLWMHGEFLLMNQAKMAKSEGGFVKLSDLKERGFEPLDYRYHCFTAHYRKQLDFTWESLESSKTARRRLREAALAVKDEPLRFACADHEKAFRAALEDDLNMPGALAAVWDCVKSNVPSGSKRAILQRAENLLGLGLFKADVPSELPPELQQLLDRRAKARADKNFKEADVLRRDLEINGILVEDTKAGQKWRRR